MFDESKYEEYTRRIRQIIRDITKNYPIKEEMMEDLVQAGLIGLIEAEKNYNPDKGASLTTYADKYIRGEIIAALKSSPGVLLSFDDEENGLANTVAAPSEDESYKTIDKKPPKKSEAEKELTTYRLAVHILNVLKNISDEEHIVSQKNLHTLLNNTPGATAKNRQTIAAAISALLLEMNAHGERKISYKEDSSGRKTGYYYIHEFSHEELDAVIEAVIFSGSISDEDKRTLVVKLVNLTNVYYESPFYNKKNQKLLTNNHAIFNRTYKTNVSNNIKTLQKAINSRERISFRFNAYNADKSLSPLLYSHELSPYQIVVYHDMYYLIGGKEGSTSPSHYRVDLMSDIKPAKDSNSSVKQAESMARFKELRDSKATWQPDKYMSEHLYMGYDKPRRILIKIKNDKYTVLHDWFGDNYEKSFTPCENGYDYVYIVTSPSMIVHWALQYADIVEVMDKDIRSEIRKQIEKLEEKYNEG